MSYSLLLLALDFSDRGEFSATLELPEGRHEYKFIVDGEWMHDPDVVSRFIHILSRFTLTCKFMAFCCKQI